jgi:HlyD family secretion protein
MTRKKIVLLVVILLAFSVLVGSYVILGRFVASSQNLNANQQMQTVEKQKQVVALGRIEPADKVIKLTAPQSNGGNARLAKLLVTEGEEISDGQVIAELDGKDKQRATVNEAFERVKIAESKLAQIRVGAKQGDLEAQKANIERLEAEIRKAETELERTKSRGKNATAEVLAIPKLETDLRKAESELNRTKFPTAQGIIPAPEYVAIKRLEADLANALSELRRAESLFAKGDVSKSTLDARSTACSASCVIMVN